MRLKIMAFSFGEENNVMYHVNKLRDVRVLKRITQFDLQLASGIQQSRISLIENGLIEPSHDEKKRLSYSLGLKVKDIWGDAENE